MDPSKKRKNEGSSETDLILAKKQKTNEVVVHKDTSEESDIIKVEGIERTSSLRAPIILMTGHQAEIFAVRFSPDGKSLASSSRDKQIFLWNVFEKNENYMVLKGHKHAILDIVWTKDSENIYSASCDKTVGEWNAITGARSGKYSEHESIVNAITCGRVDKRIFASVSNDCTCRLWDNRTRKSSSIIQYEYPLTAVELSDLKNQLFTGGIDNVINVWDTRNLTKPTTVLKGHTDTITCLRLDPYETFLLSTSMDNYIRSWDIRPYDMQDRCKKIISGYFNNLEGLLIKSNWSNDGGLIGSGSSDRFVYIWDSLSRDIKYRLPGHTGITTDMDFHPYEPIIVSCSTDKQIFLGEIENE